MTLRSRIRVLVLAGVAALVVAATASAHARISPSVSLANELQLYSLAVPTEKENLTTTKIVLTVPQGFSIDSFVPSPGWTRAVQQTGSGDSAVIQKVTWTGGNTPTEEDSLFQFLAQPSQDGDVHVRRPADLLRRLDRRLVRLGVVRRLRRRRSRSRARSAAGRRRWRSSRSSSARSGSSSARSRSSRAEGAR